MADFEVVEGGVTAARGFQAGGVTAKIKPSGKPDLALIYSEVPAAAAAVFTTNLVQAASVVYDRELLARHERVRAIVVNSGNANAATGEAGVAAVHRTVEVFARLLALEPDEVLVASTGVIGVPLPVDKIQQAAPELVRDLSHDGSERAAQAILTTDLGVKSYAVRAQIGAQSVHVGGIAKGSGMIHPQMATLLAFVTSDCAIEPGLWRRLVSQATERSFNQITVDGDTSTNDLLVALAGGGAGGTPISDPESKEARLVGQMLEAVLIELAKMVARDGEGATKLIEVQVSGTTDDSQARQIARTVAGSSLVKAAMFGNDPNWGRLAAAAGRAGVPFDPAALAVRLGLIDLMESGQPLRFDRPAAAQYLRTSDPVQVQIVVGSGPGNGLAWGCDLSYDYVKINAEYTT